MTMREKIARALWEKQRRHLAFDHLEWDTQLPGDRKPWLEFADATLDAMREPTEAILRAMAESKARDDEGEFPPVMDLIDFSGENKRRTVLAQAWRDAIDAVRGEARP